MFSYAIFDYLTSNQSDDSEITSDTHETLASENDEEMGLIPGSTAPDFSLTTLDGESVRLSDFRGQKIMLNFWATWCAPCRAEMPDMQKFYDDKDVVVLA